MVFEELFSFLPLFCNPLSTECQKRVCRGPNIGKSKISIKEYKSRSPFTRGRRLNGKENNFLSKFSPDEESSPPGILGQFLEVSILNTIYIYIYIHAHIHVYILIFLNKMAGRRESKKKNMKRERKKKRQE